MSTIVTPNSLVSSTTNIDSEVNGNLFKTLEYESNSKFNRKIQESDMDSESDSFSGDDDTSDDDKRVADNPVLKERLKQLDRYATPMKHHINSSNKLSEHNLISNLYSTASVPVSDSTFCKSSRPDLVENSSTSSEYRLQQFSATESPTLYSGSVSLNASLTPRQNFSPPYSITGIIANNSGPNSQHEMNSISNVHFQNAKFYSHRSTDNSTINSYECTNNSGVFMAEDDVCYESSDNLVCKLCNIDFFNFQSFDEHMKSHTIYMNKSYQCDRWSYSAQSEKRLLKRMDTVHVANKCGEYECKICHCYFPNEDGLRFHDCSSAGFHSYQCSECGRVFKTKLRLKYHADIHNPRKPYVCDIEGCDRAFRTPKYLKNHRDEFHKMQPKSYSCPVINCELVFHRKTHLRRHVATHDDTNKKYFCQWPNCQLNFTNEEALNVHYRKHTTLKCNLCFFVCYDEVMLDQHYQMQHNSIGNYASNCSNNVHISNQKSSFQSSKVSSSEDTSIHTTIHHSCISDMHGSEASFQSHPHNRKFDLYENVNQLSNNAQTLDEHDEDSDDDNVDDDNDDDSELVLKRFKPTNSDFNVESTLPNVVSHFTKADQTGSVEDYEKAKNYALSVLPNFVSGDKLTAQIDAIVVELSQSLFNEPFHIFHTFLKPLKHFSRDELYVINVLEQQMLSESPLKAPNLPRKRGRKSKLQQQLQPYLERIFSIESGAAEAMAAQFIKSAQAASIGGSTKSFGHPDDGSRKFKRFRIRPSFTPNPEYPASDPNVQGHLDLNEIGHFYDRDGKSLPMDFANSRIGSNFHPDTYQKSLLFENNHDDLGNATLTTSPSESNLFGFDYAKSFGSQQPNGQPNLGDMMEDLDTVVKTVSNQQSAMDDVFGTKLQSPRLNADFPYLMMAHQPYLSAKKSLEVDDTSDPLTQPGPVLAPLSSSSYDDSNYFSDQAKLASQSSTNTSPAKELGRRGFTADSSLSPSSSSLPSISPTKMMFKKIGNQQTMNIATGAISDDADMSQFGMLLGSRPGHNSPDKRHHHQMMMINQCDSSTKSAKMQMSTPESSNIPNQQQQATLDVDLAKIENYGPSSICSFGSIDNSNNNNNNIDNNNNANGSGGGTPFSAHSRFNKQTSADEQPSFDNSPLISNPVATGAVAPLLYKNPIMTHCFSPSNSSPINNTSHPMSNASSSFFANTATPSSSSSSSTTTTPTVSAVVNQHSPAESSYSIGIVHGLSGTHFQHCRSTAMTNASHEQNPICHYNESGLNGVGNSLSLAESNVSNTPPMHRYGSQSFHHHQKQQPYASANQFKYQCHDSRADNSTPFAAPTIRSTSNHSSHASSSPPNNPNSTVRQSNDDHHDVADEKSDLISNHSGAYAAMEYGHANCSPKSLHPPTSFRHQSGENPALADMSYASYYQQSQPMNHQLSMGEQYSTNMNSVPQSHHQYHYSNTNGNYPPSNYYDPDAQVANASFSHHHHNQIRQYQQHQQLVSIQSHHLSNQHHLQHNLQHQQRHMDKRNSILSNYMTTHQPYRNIAQTERFMF